jgi:hypothetical protein
MSNPRLQVVDLQFEIAWDVVGCRIEPHVNSRYCFATRPARETVLRGHCSTSPSLQNISPEQRLRGRQRLPQLTARIERVSAHSASLLTAKSVDFGS